MTEENLHTEVLRENLSFPPIKKKKNLQAVVADLKNYYDSISTAVIIFRFNELIYTNNEAARLTGYDKKELWRRISSLEIIHPAYVNNISEVISVWENGSFKKCEYDFKIIMEDGKDRWMHCSADTIFIHSIPFIIITAEDLSKENNLRAEMDFYLAEIENGKRILDLKARQISKLNLLLTQSENKLKKFMLDRERIISIISHDLKTPFTGVLGFAEILLSDIESLTPNEIRQFARNIHDSASLLVQLLNSLMEWARLGSGKAEYKPGKIELEKIVDETILVLSNSARKKNILIQRDIMENHFVNADKRMLRSIFQNLIFNSIKFTYRNGNILITAREENDFLIVGVKDSGTGILGANKEKLFNPEKHFSSTGTENEKGTGLGLLMCKDFVELHGGRIWVESEPGSGSVFYFTLPLYKETTASDSKLLTLNN